MIVFGGEVLVSVSVECVVDVLGTVDIEVVAFWVIDEYTISVEI